MDLANMRVLRLVRKIDEIRATRFYTDISFQPQHSKLGYDFNYLFDVMPYVCSFDVDGRTNSVTLNAKFIRNDWLYQSAGVDKFEGRPEQPPF
jgi:hypothetical protein